MMSELTDVLGIIATCNESMNRIITKWEVEEGNQYPEGLTELRSILNTYTAQICRNIVKHEDKLVGDTLEDMEKYEYKTDDKEAKRMNVTVDYMSYDLQKHSMSVPPINLVGNYSFNAYEDAIKNYVKKHANNMACILDIHYMEGEE